MSFAWDSEPNPAGYQGYAYSTGGKVGQGQHGSMSRHELNNVGLAGGPSFRNGAVVAAPTGNIDFAPTILRLLGINEPSHARHGRVIDEALTANAQPATEAWVATHEAQAGDYRQRVQISHVGGSQYIDWGNRV